MTWQGVRVGTATAGYQVEGGFNGPGDPLNNWADHEGRRGVAVTGRGCDFWNRWPEDLDRAAAMGLDVFRLGVEWARLQPTTSRRRRRPTAFDRDGLRRYVQMLIGCRQRGMEPFVTLFHWTTPWWAGPDVWLDEDGVEGAFVPYVRRVVEELNDELTGAGQPPLSYFITLNELIVVPVATYVLRVFPRGRAAPTGWPAARRALDALLLAHCRAYDVIHEVYEARGWPRPEVTTNLLAWAPYEMDRMLADLLLAGDHLSRPEDVPDYLRAQSELQEATLVPLTPRGGALHRRVQTWFHHKARRWLTPEGLPRTRAYLAQHWPRTFLDAFSFDYYDPFPADFMDLWPPRLAIRPWDWRTAPQALEAFLDLYHRSARGRPIDILENGIALRGRERRGRLVVPPRRDGLDRITALNDIVRACLRALDRGVPLRTYLYWSLLDNYEWGSFEPRFGLIGVHYAEGARRLATDAGGQDVATHVAALARAWRAGDRTALAQLTAAGP